MVIDWLLFLNFRDKLEGRGFEIKLSDCGKTRPFSFEMFWNQSQSQTRVLFKTLSLKIVQVPELKIKAGALIGLIS